MVIATRVVGKGMVATTTREMVMKTKEVGKEEGNSKGIKSNSDGKEDCNGKQQ